MGAEIDFEAGTFVTDEHQSAMFPWDSTVTADLNLANKVTANSAHPLFLLLSIQFYQLVNGVQYPLRNGSFNALSLVKVNGV